MYNYDPVSKDTRSCGTTASLCGMECALREQNDEYYAQALKRILLIHGAAMFLQGFMMLSFGDEIGQLNGWCYRNDPNRGDDSRNLHRTAFDWQNAAMRNQKGTLPNDVWTGIERLRKMRMHPCFAADDDVYTLDCGNNAILALSRERDNERITALFNFSDKKQCVDFLTEKAEVLEPCEMRLCTVHLKA